MVARDEMNKIVWEKRYSVGHSEMDTQHQIIIGAINRCIDLLGEEELDVAATRSVLQSLAGYAEEHFKSEESLLEAEKFEFLEAQKNSHGVYQAKMGLYREQKVGREPMVELVKFLNFWWMHHILLEDMEYKNIFDRDR